MTIVKYISWFACVISVEVILQLLQKGIRTKEKKWIYYFLGFLIKAFAAVALAFCSMAFCSRIFWNLWYLPVVLYAVLLCDALADLAGAILTLIQDHSHARAVTVISLILTTVFVIYGTINMEVILPKNHSYTSEKLKDSHTFVFLADLHYGNPQSEATVEKALHEIAELKPEFVLLGGDITDDRTTSEQMHHIYEALGKLGVPVYYCYGNHDRQEHADFIGGASYTPEELEETIQENGITILKDEVTVISNDLAVLGREDVSAGIARKAVRDLPSRPDEAYVICVDHSPYNESDIMETGADLQLSGHTHGGQFFPLQYVYRLGVTNILGEYKVGSTDLYVSSGIAGWYFPFRTVAHCNYEVITLNP